MPRAVGDRGAVGRANGQQPAGFPPASNADSRTHCPSSSTGHLASPQSHHAPFRDAHAEVHWAVRKGHVTPSPCPQPAPGSGRRQGGSHPCPFPLHFMFVKKPKKPEVTLTALLFLSGLREGCVDGVSTGFTHLTHTV